MKILRIDDIQYQLIYVEEDNKYSVYKRYIDGVWKDAQTDKIISYTKTIDLENLLKN
jgi:hypothetical protein